MADLILPKNAKHIRGATKRAKRIAADQAGRIATPVPDVDRWVSTIPEEPPHGPPGGFDPNEHAIVPSRPPQVTPLVLQLKILDKKRGVVPLREVINHAQQNFLRDVDHQLATRGYIRICVLKARQIGISTIIEGIAFAMSMIHDAMSTMIVSHETDSTHNILAMTRRYWDTYVFKDYSPDERYASANHLAWVNESNIKVATAKNTNAGRSRTIHILHASEVGFWPDPETLMTGLRQAVPSIGLSAIFLESTANGIGNYFYRECNKAMKGEGEFVFHFYPWHEHPEYTAEHISTEEADKYILDTLDEEEERLVETYGVSVARLIWRRWAIENLCQGDIDKFHQEYPASPHEAFVSTGRNVFPLDSLLDHYEPLIGKRGRLVRLNTGSIKFVPDQKNGWLTLFSEPSDDEDWGVYLAGGDPTHTTAGDNACIQIINRRTLEQVAVYRRKIDPVNFGRDIQLVGRYFNTAMIAPEKTGPGYATIGVVVADGYPNLYATQKIDKMQGGAVDNYGWLTNQQTKHLAISHLLKSVTDPMVTIGNQTYGLLIHDEPTFMEMRDYVTTEDGNGYENGDGSEYDDTVMALAIGVTVHNIEPAPPPYVVSEASKPKVTGPVGPGIKKGSRKPKEELPTDKRVATEAPSYSGVEQVDVPFGPDDDIDDLLEQMVEIDDRTPWERWNK